MTIIKTHQVVPHYDAQHNNNENNLQKSLTRIFIVAQIFGGLPVQNAAESDWKSIRFEWRSLRVLYTILIIMSGLLLTTIQMVGLTNEVTDIVEINRLFLSISGIVLGLLYLDFARNWPQLLDHWYCVEKSMDYEWNHSLNKRITRIFVVFMAFALIEFTMFKISSIITALDCGKDSGVLTYFLRNLTLINDYTLIDYNPFYGTLLQFLGLNLAFSWTFIDVFIMIFSAILAEQFVQINTEIELNLMAVPVESWRILRENHNRLENLCQFVNTKLTNFVLFAFVNDLFSILLGLFRSLYPVKHTFERYYFLISLSFVVLRVVFLCLYGAKVNEEHKMALRLLNNLPNHIYNDEIQKFVRQIGCTDVGFTGRNFFTVSRRLIPSIAGAIVTYELVLIQFNESLLKDVAQDRNVC